MSLKIRRFTYISFFVVFFASAAALIFYSSGYRYDFKKGKVVATGSLFIDSKPTNALVLLDGKQQEIRFVQMLKDVGKFITSGELKEKTPSIITNLPPNEYLVEVKKDGFVPWSKKLTVSSNKVTFASEIMLFSENPTTELLFRRDNIRSFVSPDQKKMAVVSDSGSGSRQIEIISLENGQITASYAPDFSPADIRWAPSSAKIMVVGKKSGGQEKIYLIAGVAGPGEAVPPDKLLPGQPNLENPKWDLKSDNILYAQDHGGNVYQADLSAQTVGLIFTPSRKTSDYLIKDGVAYCVETSPNGPYLEKRKLADGSSLFELKLPASRNYAFAADISAGKESLVALREEDKGEMILADTGATDPEKSILLKDAAIGAQWSEDGSKLLFYNDFELMTFNFKEGKKEILGRYGNGSIGKAVWYPKENYAVFSLGESVKAIEEDSRDRRNTADLAKAESIENIAMDASNPYLYLSGKISGEEGIYKIKIQ